MHPCWFDFSENIGIGITAFSDDDAQRIFQAAFGNRYRVLRARDPRHARIGSGHVVPNMASWSKRGIWYPLGYEETLD